MLVVASLGAASPRRPRAEEERVGADVVEHEDLARLWIICEQITGNTWTLSSQITHGDTDYFKRLAGSSRKVAYSFLE